MSIPAIPSEPQAATNKIKEKTRVDRSFTEVLCLREFLVLQSVVVDGLVVKSVAEGT